MGTKNSDSSIELLNCPNGGGNCTTQLKNINKLLAVGQDCFEIKDFRAGFEALEQANKITFELSQNSCIKCAELFRDVIKNSCNIQVSELENLTTGLFKRSKYLPDYQYSKEVQEKLNKNGTANT